MFQKQANYVKIEYDACNKEMILDEGDVTFDAKWFHSKCWNGLQNKI